MIDFGLAQEVGTEWSVGFLIDWWSVGSLLYEMLVGHVSTCTLYLQNLDVSTVH